MANLLLDRHDPDFAAFVMESQCPTAAARRAVMAQLVRSLAAAESVAPMAASVTLFRNGFRLNVGAVEALTLFEGEVRVFLHGAVPGRVHRCGSLIRCGLALAPHPSWLLHLQAADLLRVTDDVAPAHAAYVRGAAVTRAGRPRRASYARYDSPGLRRYALECVRRGSLTAVPAITDRYAGAR